MSLDAASNHSLCPFCRTNGLLEGPVIAESSGAYLMEAKFGAGIYLIIPTAHVESLTDLPDVWWADVKTLLTSVPGLTEDYNMSVNIGQQAGQSLKHLHFWIIPRTAGHPSSGKGFARLITEADQQVS